MDCDDYGATTIEMRDDTEEDYDGGDQEEKEKNYRSEKYMSGNYARIT